MADNTKLYKATRMITGTYGTKTEDSEPFELKETLAKDLLNKGLIEEVKQPAKKAAKEADAVETKEEKTTASRTTKGKKISTKDYKAGQVDK